jgi:glycosyltransferase involved in cell wall biosynthesis
MKPQPVLHVVPASPFGGAQRLAIDLAETQNQNGLNAALWYTNHSGIAKAIAAAAGVNVVSPGRGDESLYFRVGALGSTLRNREFEIVHLHIPPPWLAGLLPRKRSFRLVSHLHLPPPIQYDTPRRYIEATLARIVLSRSDLVIATSQWIEEEWRCACPTLAISFRKIYNGIPVPSGEAVYERKNFTIGMACRLCEGKGIEEYIDLAARIHCLAPHVRFRLAGDGPLRAHYEDLASKRGLQTVMSFCGFLENTTLFWRSLDIAAFTSPREAFGLGLIEPVAHGVPVIAYRNGTGSDEVIDRCRGIVAKEYGQVNELAKVAVALAQSRQERTRLTAEGLADIRQHFSIERMEAGVRAAYREVRSPAMRDRVGYPVA